MTRDNEFDVKALEWDKNPLHHARSMAIANEMLRLLPFNKGMRALEFGAGTGILSFLLKDYIDEIILMDNSVEMVNVTNKKIKSTGAKNLKTVVFDLEHESYTGKPFDLIFAQMALHHVDDIDSVLSRFYRILNPSGYLAIADLYTEDGSFHGEGFKGHNGFNIEKLTAVLEKQNFDVITCGQCFVIDRKISEEITSHYPVFLLIANRR
jgi:ubiquinone/menaquinone biosynthesis C-methylase UbiE